jgi:hypothetical protein
MSTFLQRMLALTVATCFTASAQTTPLTEQQKEQFLAKAKITKIKEVSKGVTGTSRVTLSDGTLTHDASVQAIDQYEKIFQAAAGKSELNFKDTYKFNIAGWKLAEMVGLGFMVPPSVDRKFKGNPAAYTWWLDDVQMEEGERQKKNLLAPDQTTWKREWALIQMFDQLIHNNDRNVGNVLIDKNWHVWMIDHTRAFRINKTLPKPESLTQIDRGVLAKLKELNKASLTSELKKWLNGSEIDAVMARRDLILKAFETKGESALFDLVPAK